MKASEIRIHNFTESRALLQKAKVQALQVGRIKTLAIEIIKSNQIKSYLFSNSKIHIWLFMYR